MLVCITLNKSTFTQNWFPLEVGNRWDFDTWTWCHGGSGWSDTLTLEIVGDTNFSTGKNYFILSSSGLFDTEYLAIKDDSLYYFNTNDSTDCLMFAFNQALGSYYYSCKDDSVFFANESNNNIFGIEDSQQDHGTYFTTYDFSKKFGLFHLFNTTNGICEIYYDLAGCIISGITYGELLTSNESMTSNVSQYSLSQNYPNPFNPSTVISWQSPVGSWQSLKIYDVLGNEVATLVNEYKPAGNYDVEFNIAHESLRAITSGVYFYRLQAGSFIETKKMILLR